MHARSTTSLKTKTIWSWCWSLLRASGLHGALRAGRWPPRKRLRPLSLDEARSVRSRPKHKIEARSVGESSEVPVSREERNSSVDAALGNQRVAEACLAALRQHLRSQLSRSLPIARPDLDQGHF